jgi:addiction module HigA family antidote
MMSALAREIKIPATRMSEIVNGRRALNADAALRLSRYFGNTPEFWINLQSAYDLATTTRIERQVRPRRSV